MSAASFLEELRGKGVHVWLEGGKLKYQTPGGSLGPSLLSQIRKHKLELVEALGRELGATAAGEWPVEFGLSHQIKVEPGSLKIGPPSPRLLVRGETVSVPVYVSSTMIPEWAVEFQDSPSHWREIPKHWREPDRQFSDRASKHESEDAGPELPDAADEGYVNDFSGLSFEENH